MRRVYICIPFLLVFLCIYSLDNFVQEVLRKNPTVIKNFVSSHSFITILKTEDKKYFIVKQKKNWGSVERSALWMILSSTIALTVKNILSQKVCIVKKDLSFPGKKYHDQIAILMTQVPGVMVRACNKHNKLSIKQRKKEERKVILIGVTCEVIKNMSKHSDLARIVALDTFIGYSDRHRGNFFYDKKTDRFWAIDMDSPRKNLCKITCENFEKILDNKSISFSKKEINALREFSQTLELLIDSNHPDKVIKQMMEVAERIGIRERKGYRIFYLPRLLEYSDLIKESYEDAKKLLNITKKLIKKIKF